MIPYKQLSVADIFQDCQEKFDNDKPAFLSLLENHIDLDEIIPVTFYNHFYASTGRTRKYPLRAFLWALIIQRIFSIPTDQLLLTFLCLLDYAGISAHDLGHCYLSGAFSAHSDLESAITIGIFQDLERIRYSVLKNSSLEGAKTLLLNHTKLAEANTLVENMYCVQFASIPDFLIKMQAAKFIPHTDMKRYPSIINLLKKSSA